jgi:hypothetical protein
MSSNPLRMERISAGIQEPLIDGSYRPAEVSKFAWMCTDCRLVWAMRHQARDCASRNHVANYVQEYWTNGYDPITGKANPPTLYPREAIRREPIDHLPITPPTPIRRYSVRHKGYLFHIVSDPEHEAKESLRCQYTHDDWRINATGAISKARIGGHVVWQYTADGLPHSVFVTPAQAEALDLPKP